MQQATADNCGHTMMQPGKSGESDAETFYGNLAQGYDLMVDFERRVESASHFVRTLREKWLHTTPRVGVDLGCGTGAYTLALAGSTLETVGVDLSRHMLTAARRHAAERNDRAMFYRAPLQDLPAELPWGRSDIVLCLGNTLPHLTDPGDLRDTFLNMSRLLAEGGICVVQTLNYDRLLACRERVVSIDRQGNQEFIRFYDFLDDLVRFNILTIVWRDSQPAHAPIQSVLLRPYTAKELEKIALEAELRVEFRAGDLGFHPFDAEHSDTILLVLRHSGH